MWLQIALAAHLGLLPGCVRYRPGSFEPIPVRERVVYETVDGVRVGAASLGERESMDLFGVSMAREGIQPVWIEIHNGREEPVVFFQQSVDAMYFAPIEAAYANHYSPTRRMIGYGLASLIVWPLVFVLPFQYFSARGANKKMNALFVEHSLGNCIIEPGETREGFVFTHIDQGTKYVRVILYGSDDMTEVYVRTAVPGARLDHHSLDLHAVYDEAEVRTLANREELLEAITELPQVTTDKSGTGTGDPVNLVVLGTLDDLLSAFTRAGWHETDVLDLSSGLKTARSFLFGSEYRYSPMSDQFLFGRRQDVAFQRARASIHQRNHLRLWYSPIRFAGRPVWVGQVNRDIGVKFTHRSWTLTTHAVDPDVDDSRENVTGDLIHSGRLRHIAYVDGVGARSEQAPGRNLMNDPFYTDGRRAVYVLFEANSLAVESDDQPGAFLTVQDAE